MTPFGDVSAIAPAPRQDPADRLESRIITALRTARLPVNTEQELQREIGNLLEAHKIDHAREVKVAGGRIDFLAGEIARVASYASRSAPAGIGIEVKIKGGKRAIHRQCAAYCQDPRIAHLIVVTGTALALPSVMHGKPVTIVEIGKAWL